MSALQKVMMVEDDEDIALLARISLEEFGGFTVQRFASGAEALAGVDAFAPDFILLDYRMPGMKGDELLVELRKRPALAKVPVAFMTASLMPSHVERLKELGAIDIIAKPFDPVTLPDAIRAAWEKRPR